MQEDGEKGGSGMLGTKMYTYLARGKARAKWLLQVTTVLPASAECPTLVMAAVTAR